MFLVSRNMLSSTHKSQNFSNKLPIWSNGTKYKLALSMMQLLLLYHFFAGFSAFLHRWLNSSPPPGAVNSSHEVWTMVFQVSKMKELVSGCDNIFQKDLQLVIEFAPFHIVPPSSLIITLISLPQWLGEGGRGTHP